LKHLLLPKTSKSVTIFEGPDGGGKTTAALAYADLIGGKYIHCPPFPKVWNNLGRFYFEMMWPALMGYQPVVMDRSWLSEPIYGAAMREGVDRIGPIFRRMLERVALRCGAVVINCLPPWEVVQEVYTHRQSSEYVTTLPQMHQVYEQYTHLAEHTDLDVTHYDFTVDGDDKTGFFNAELVYADIPHPEQHPLEYESAGRWDAPIVLLGERFADHKDKDSWYQYPFVSWTKEGSSQWFTYQLELLKLSEQKLLWLNINNERGTTDLRAFLMHGRRFHARPTVIALGEAVAAVAEKQGLAYLKIPHPSHWKRFKVKEVFAPLIEAMSLALEAQV